MLLDLLLRARMLARRHMLRGLLVRGGRRIMVVGLRWALLVDCSRSCVSPQAVRATATDVAAACGELRRFADGHGSIVRRWDA